MQDFEHIFEELSNQGSPYMDYGVWWVKPLEGYILCITEMTLNSRNSAF